MRIIGVGASVLDTIIELDSYPVEDSKKKAERVFVSGGGPVGNALVCISKLGIDASYLGLLSNNQSGQYLVDEFKQYGVDVSNIKLVDNTSAFTSFILLNAEKGTRTCVFDRGSVPDDPSLLDLNIIKNYDVLHLDGNYLNIAIEAAKVAKQNRVKVSLDAGSLYPGIERLLPYVDIFVASEDFAIKLTKEEDINLAIKKIDEIYHPEVLVVTEGSKGGTYLEKGIVHHYNAFKVNCVDSNGAGDTFHGAFLVAYLEGKGIKECCEFASATSAIKCMKAGVRQALPNKKEVINFLKGRN